MFSNAPGPSIGLFVACNPFKRRSAICRLIKQYTPRYQHILLTPLSFFPKVFQRFSDTLAGQTDHSDNSTGHVMIVAGSPRKIGLKKHKNKKYWEYRVPIIDSARGSHGSDSRNSSAYEAWPAVDYTGTTETGVGEGFVCFGVDKKGCICYERWNNNRDPEFSGDFAIG